MKIVHSWLSDYLGESLPSSDKVVELLNFHAFEVDGVEEVEGENVIDIDVLPNRASDCLCHRGIAREIATCLNISLKNDPLQQPVELSKNEDISISISDAEACPRFTASVITGIEVKDSPEWLQKRLKAIGQRPINNIVDATNYIMYAIGQPLHAYDADLFPKKDGKWMFDVRFAKEGETVSLLAEGGKDEERVVELKGTELLIVDGASNTPVGLAGVKGGRYAGVHSGTKNIIIEAAHFHPTITRKTARGLGIVIDASKRFENEPSRELPLFAQRDIIALITDIAGGKCEGVVDEYLIKKEPVMVTVNTKRVNSLLGLSLSNKEIEDLILRTGSEFVNKNENDLSVVSPFERTDLTIEEDFIEEVGRIHGLNNISSIPPDKLSLNVINSRHYYSEKIRRALLSEGFSEVITSSFQKKGNLQLLNALASDKSYLRESLINNISSVLDSNVSHVDLLGLVDVRVFEIGTVFNKSEVGITERIVLTIGTRTRSNGYNPKDDVILESGMRVVEEIFGATLNWKVERGVAELDFGSVLSTLPVPNSYEPLVEKNPVTFKSISPYPAMARDIALWVNEEESPDSVLEVLAKNTGPLCVRQTLFDTFSKEGRTSYAFRLAFQANNRTLTDVEINSVMEGLYKKVNEQGWEVR